MLVSNSKDISIAATLETLGTEVMSTTLKMPGTKGTPATVRCPEQLVYRLQSKPPQQCQQAVVLPTALTEQKQGCQQQNANTTETRDIGNNRHTKI